MAMSTPPRLTVPRHLLSGACLRHYKGGLYQVVGACLVEATYETGILYRPLQGDAADLIWMRPAAAFDDWVDTEHGRVRRFAPA
jgi:hypothetical protein